jgi:hypothetical protein
MKKYISIFLTFILIISITACGNSGVSTPKKEIEGSLAEIMDQIYDRSGTGFSDEVMLNSTEITKENISGFIGTDEIDFEEGLAREPMINAIPHSLVLLRMNAEANIDDAKTKIQENADPQKWICVFVDESDLKVESEGNLILLIIAENSDKYAEAFHNLAK